MLIRFVFPALLSLAFCSWAYSADNADAAKLYESKCAKCHGKDGDGTGKKGRDLKPAPTDFRDPKVFSEKKKDGLEPDERLFKATKQGGPAVKQSKDMPDYPDLTDDQVKGLVEYIKTFQKK